MAPTLSKSCNVERFQLIFGLTFLLFPCGLYSSTCLVVFVGYFLSLWPIQLHFLLLIVVLISSCLVFFQSSLFYILLGRHKDVSEATANEDLEFVVERLSSSSTYHSHREEVV